MKHSPMTAAELASLNMQINVRIANGVEPGQATYDVCIDNSLLPLRKDDESGVLFAHYQTGRRCYAWASGGVDDQI